MKYYFAPLEGITGYIFRNAYEKYYGNIDKYFAPFASPADNCPITPKEKRDLEKENNLVDNLVPQIITCKSRHFIDCAKEMFKLGYDEINFNLGCPSGTVVAKGKGSGFLTETDDLENFFDEVFEFASANNVKLSVKTRIGRFSPEEWEDILPIYNKFPLSELIIHPRIQKDFYKEAVRREYFDYSVENSKHKLVYNGDLFTTEDILDFLKKHESTDVVMLGRGLLYNPELVENTKAILKGDSALKFDTVRFRSFHDEIYNEYKKIMAPDINVLYRMKELWTYWKKTLNIDDRLFKKIMKSKKFYEYDLCVKQAFND